MTREQAFEKASELFGMGAVVGQNPQYPDAPFYVGCQPSCKDWTRFGAGASWEEAFANVKDVLFQRANRTFVFKGDEKESKKT